MLKPGVIALILVMIMAFSLGVQFNHHQEILDKAYSQVVVVYCQHTLSGRPEYGTGWFIDHNHVITANHVVASCVGKPLLIRSPWASNATVEAYDTNLDIALLEVERPPSWASGLPLSYSLAIGDDVYVVGYPIQLYEETGHSIKDMSKIPRVQKASVTWINPDKKVFEFSPGTDAGNSGGPIVSAKSGGVVGIVIYARSGVVSEGFYGLRMDGIAQFLSENHVKYQVAGSNARKLAEWVGVGALVALLGLIIIGGRFRIAGKQVVIPILAVLVTMPMLTHAGYPQAPPGYTHRVCTQQTLNLVHPLNAISWSWIEHRTGVWISAFWYPGYGPGYRDGTLWWYNVTASDGERYAGWTEYNSLVFKTTNITVHAVVCGYLPVNHTTTTYTNPVETPPGEPLTTPAPTSNGGKLFWLGVGALVSLVLLVLAKRW